MQYMLLIYGDENGAQPPEGMDAHLKGYYDLDEALLAAQGSTIGHALHPVATATTVRVRDGEVLATDGHFAETKEQLGGYYLVEADDLDAAIAWAAKIPGSRVGSVEVRPVMEMPATFEDYQRATSSISS